MSQTLPTSPQLPPARVAELALPRPALRLRDVLEIIPVSKATLYAGIKTGRFPPPFKNGRISMWRSEDIAQWLSNPDNLIEYRLSARSPAMRRSEVFRGELSDWVASVEVLVELLLCMAMVKKFEEVRSQGRSSAADREAARAMRHRVAELARGAQPRIGALAWWAPPRRRSRPEPIGYSDPAGLAQNSDVIEALHAAFAWRDE